MDNSISKAPSTGLGHCTVCGAWAKLEMWDDRLNGRFCVECFDYVVDAEELLASKGLVRPGPERKQPQKAEGKRLLLACAASAPRIRLRPLADLETTPVEAPQIQLSSQSLVPIA